jgi:capsule polysaccharide export protein KpsE/RkpR
MTSPDGYQGGRDLTRPPVGLPTQGVFASSEVLPLIAGASRALAERRSEWLELREAANRAKSRAKSIRANLIVNLRTWGNDVTGQQIKTSAERNEWADADADVQLAELEADLAQTAAMAAYESYQDAQAEFSAFQSLLGIERDELKREHDGPPGR